MTLRAKGKKRKRRQRGCLTPLFARAERTLMRMLGLMNSPAPRLLLVLCFPENGWPRCSMHSWLLHCSLIVRLCPVLASWVPCLVRSAWHHSACYSAAAPPQGLGLQIPRICKACWYGRWLFGLGGGRERRRRELHCVPMDEEAQVAAPLHQPSAQPGARLCAGSAGAAGDVPWACLDDVGHGGSPAWRSGLAKVC